MTFACCRSGNVHYEYGILVTEHSFVSSYTFTRVGMTASSIGYLFREVISINKELIYSHIYSVVSPIDGHLIMGLMGQRTTETTCPPNPCASERVDGVQAEFSVRMLMKPARAQRFALGPKLPWSNLGRLPVIVNPVIGEGFCRRHMPRIAITDLIRDGLLDQSEYGKGSSTLE